MPCGTSRKTDKHCGKSTSLEAIPAAMCAGWNVQRALQPAVRRSTYSAVALQPAVATASFRACGCCNCQPTGISNFDRTGSNWPPLHPRTRNIATSLSKMCNNNKKETQLLATRTVFEKNCLYLQSAAAACGISRPLPEQ